MQQEIDVQGLRLSPQQKRLWLWQQEGHAGQVRAVFAVDGSFEEETVRDSFRQVMARHESLRTTFYRQPGTKLPFQVVGEDSELAWQAVDLRHLADDAARKRAAAEAAHGHEGCDGERGPLVRATFCQWTDGENRLLLDLPGLCADTASLWNLAAEMTRSLAGGEAAEEPVQYGHYSEWQHELLEGDDAVQGRAWWARRLVTSEHHLALPFERESSLEPAGAIQRPIQRDLSAFGAERLQQAAAAAQVSVPIVLCACWAALLYRMTARRDLVCWWRSDGRPYEELAGGIGRSACRRPAGCTANRCCARSANSRSTRRVSPSRWPASPCRTT